MQPTNSKIDRYSIIILNMEPQSQSTHQFTRTEIYFEARLLRQLLFPLHKDVCSERRPMVLWAWQEWFISHSCLLKAMELLSLA
jgi:hypothetical protein